ncbi:vesicle-associated membrane protein 4 [Plakobranchus ocellatus]|uniref:Vesicle-associated membrane protein 4 n=1 Tax=Plakobranchus ocellatus TaxID=259542 RepID=A0AAV3Z142_9GAST|nr:vesicle-associated membrane protein 4 [Plakobranchus ocellatus]
MASNGPNVTHLLARQNHVRGVGEPQAGTRFERLRETIEELINTMRSGVSIWKRKSSRIKKIHSKLDKLSNISRVFKLRAKGLHETVWWKHSRMKAILQLEIGLIAAVISVALAHHTTETR